MLAERWFSEFVVRIVLKILCSTLSSPLGVAESGDNRGCGTVVVDLDMMTSDFFLWTETYGKEVGLFLRRYIFFPCSSHAGWDMRSCSW